MIPILKGVYAIDIEVRPLPQFENQVKDEEIVDKPNFYPWCCETYGVSIAWGEDYETESRYFTGGDIPKLIKLLSEHKLKLIAHNVFFDWSKLYYDFELNLNFIGDTGVIAQATNNSDFVTSFGLKQFTERMYHVVTQDDELKTYLRLHHKIAPSKYGAFIHLCPPEMIEKYCRLDSHYCWRIWNDSHKWVKSDISVYMEIFMSEVRLTISQFIEGILVDRVGMLEKKIEISDQILRIEEEFLSNEELKPYIEQVQRQKMGAQQAKLKKKVLVFEEWKELPANKFNMNSTDQLKMLFDSQKLHFENGKFNYPFINCFPNSKVKNPASPKLGTKFLHDYGIGGKILADKGEKITLVSHLDRALDESMLTGRIHAHINLLGTKTGRISASGVNIIATPISDPAYGKFLVTDSGYLLLVRDVCYHPSTEYLTERGWVPILQITEEDKIWQVDPLSLIGSFTKPLRIIKKNYDGDIYSYISGQNRGTLTVTEGHRMFWVGQQKHKRKDKRDLRKWSLSQENVPSFNCNIATFSRSETESFFSKEDIWRVAALQADSYIGKYSYHIQVNKPRKVQKLTELFGAPSRVAKNIRPTHNYYSHTWDIKFSHPLLKGKIFDLSQLGANQADLFFEALLFWDSSYTAHKRYKTGRFQYYTTEYKNAEAVQIFAVKNGYEARIVTRPAATEKSKTFYSVSIKKEGTIRFQPESKGSTCKILKEHYRGEVGCVTVETGLILVRNEGQTFLSGNCALEPTLLACLSDDPVLKYATFEGEGIEPTVKDGILWIDDIYLTAGYSAPFLRPQIEDKLDLSNWVKNSDYEKKKLKEIRTLCKNLVLTTNYGGGPQKIQDKILEDLQVTIPLKNIDIFQKAYWATFSTASQYKRSLEKEAKNNGFFVNIGGYPLTFYDRPGGIVTGTHKALNKMLQSSAAVVMKLILHLLLKLIKGRDDVKPMICDWHDATFLQVREDKLDEIVAITDLALEQANNILQLPLKLRFDKNVGRCLYDAK